MDEQELQGKKSKCVDEIFEDRVHHSVQLAGHIQNLVEQFAKIDCNFQLC